MNPLRHALQCFKGVKSRAHIIVFPHPVLVHDFGGPKVYGGYHLKAQRDFKITFTKILSGHPLTFAGSNIVSTQKFKRGSLQSIDSGWMTVVDSGRKNAKGQSVAEILTDLIYKFPDYDLRSEEGSEMAICDIENKLSEVASFVKVAKVTKQTDCSSTRTG